MKHCSNTYTCLSSVNELSFETKTNIKKSNLLDFCLLWFLIFVLVSNIRMKFFVITQARPIKKTVKEPVNSESIRNDIFH